MRPALSTLALLALLEVAACGDPSFDRAKWAQGRDVYDADSPRQGMVGDVERAGVVAGAARARVRELLGQPDATDGNTDTYFLGRAAYAPDDRTLVITYDDRGVVVSVTVADT
jgi:outer membrane protein assembly factor BamE (lipoprotein component of BamABCDE complex)